MEQPTPQQLAQTTLAFLERVQLNAKEAEAFLMCKQWLSYVANPPVPSEDEKKKEPAE